ncbi:MAG: zf-HC2 domain-containing protein, partial [Candidatus Rokubacteria bacterium]|nr:zf-HC2 domain-containing protein [Candidatus Rokubacteria bacterium]
MTPLPERTPHCPSELVLTAYVERQLIAAQEQEAVELHLRECAACRAWVEPEKAALEAVEAKILAERRRRRRLIGWGSLGAVVALALVGMLAYSIREGA